MTLSLVWYKRDLRIRDHEPLAQAAQRGPVLGLYVYEPCVYEAEEHDAAHLQFVNDCLFELEEEWRRLGSRLLILRGEIIPLLDKLHDQLKFESLWSHEETGLAATYRRDRAVKAWARGRGVEWSELAQHGVVRPLAHRDGWSRHWLNRMKQRLAPSLTRLEGIDERRLDGIESGILTATDLGIGGIPRERCQSGGEREAHTTLDSFLLERGHDYQRAMSTPVEGESSCSRLSPHLAYGSLSVRNAYHAVRERLDVLKRSATDEAKSWRQSLASFEKRLRWHCHFIQKFEDEPEIEFRNFNRAFDGLRQEDASAWNAEEARRYRAFEEAATGYPFVDACLRSLRATGWINFRMRAMLMSFASYHLWLHWKQPAIFLARTFVDFEPGIHYAQSQMQSGVTGINTVRIYSPIKQAKDQDPSGAFIRRWVPELAEVPDHHLVEPQKMDRLEQQMASCEIGVDYPAPIVEHATAYRSARDQIFAVRKTELARSEAKRVYNKHGSRRRPSDRRGPSRKVVDPKTAPKP